jgi:hypothetical protein
MDEARADARRQNLALAAVIAVALCGAGVATAATSSSSPRPPRVEESVVHDPPPPVTTPPPAATPFSPPPFAAASGQGPRLGGGHNGQSRQVVKEGHMTVSGGQLAPDVIRRIVRMNFGRFRLCYEQGLRASSTLSGVVNVRFVIGRDGSVTTVRDDGSTLPDQGVVRCVVRAFQNFAFPAPEGGVVTVLFPIELRPE